MFSLALTLVLVALATGNPIEPSGSGRVVGGSDAADGAYPYVGALRSQSGGLICGATVVSSEWILSAAHCIMGQFPGAMTVLVGTNTWNSGGVIAQTSRIVAHANFTGYVYAYDITLVQLTEALTFGDTVSSAVLNTLPVEATAAVLVGWGRLYFDGPLPSNLQELRINVIPNYACRQSWGDLILDQHLCAVTNYDEGTCQGDSGSPLVRENTGELLGIVVFNAAGGCAQGIADVYQRVSYFVDWIDATMSA